MHRRSCFLGKFVLGDARSQLDQLSPDSVTSNTPRSVTIRLTTPTPVKRQVALPRSSCRFEPSFFFAQFHDDDDAFDAGNEAIAPPMPFTILPGSSSWEVAGLGDCMAPRMARLMWPPRIMPKLSARRRSSSRLRRHGLLAGVD